MKASFSKSAMYFILDPGPSWTRRVAQLVKCMLNIWEIHGSVPGTAETRHGIPACDLGTGKAEEGGILQV